MYLHIHILSVSYPYPCSIVVLRWQGISDIVNLQQKAKEVSSPETGWNAEKEIRSASIGTKS